MAETLIILPSEITALTIMGGNVNPTRYMVNVAFVQVGVLEPLLGTELYEKILSDFESDTLAGKYLELFDKFAHPIVLNESVAEYIEVGNFLVENGGVFKHTADNRAETTKDDTQFLAGKYHAYAQRFVIRFNKWICKNSQYLPEWGYGQDDVDPQSVKVTSGWYFGKEKPTLYESDNTDEE